MGKASPFHKSGEDAGSMPALTTILNAHGQRIKRVDNKPYEKL